MKRRLFLKHIGAASLAAPVFTAFQVRAATSTVATARTFLSRLQPAVAGGGFELTDYWVWCGAPIRGEDGRYHLFASRVPKEVPFHPHWLFRSEIVRAESEKPVGPYRFAEVALPPRGGDFFDARSTHNPHIRKVGDTFLLLYMGTNYDGPTPSREHPEVWRSPRYLATWARKRIGLATSQSVSGPWKRLDQPLLEPRPGEWDSIATTNPSLCPLPDNSFLLAYKSRKENLGQLQVGVAHARRNGPGAGWRLHRRTAPFAVILEPTLIRCFDAVGRGRTDLRQLGRVISQSAQEHNHELTPSSTPEPHWRLTRWPCMPGMSAGRFGRRA